MILERDGALFIEGPMTVDTAAALLQQGEPLIAQRDRVLDLSGVAAVDSSALAVILAFMRTARRTGHQFQLANTPTAFDSLASLYDVSLLLFPAADLHAK
jgi:phospholipid transport system transporter-binding protein